MTSEELDRLGAILQAERALLLACAEELVHRPKVHLALHRLNTLRQPSEATLPKGKG